MRVVLPRPELRETICGAARPTLQSWVKKRGPLNHALNFQSSQSVNTCAVEPSSRRSYGYTGDARRGGSHRARVKLTGASGNCVLKGAGREASVYP